MTDPFKAIGTMAVSDSFACRILGSSGRRCQLTVLFRKVAAFPFGQFADMVFSKDGQGWLCTHSHMSLNRGVPQTSHANRPVKAW
jgi:hypothetical protein